MTDYIVAASTAWFLGFFPLFEIYVAVPAAVAMGLDDVSVLFWTIFGNYTPVILITAAYSTLVRMGRFGYWLANLSSARARRWVDRYGVWVVLFATPYAGVWAMSVTAKVLGMNTRRFMITAFISVAGHAVAILVLLRTGLANF